MTHCRSFLVIVAVLISAAASGCGYGWQNSSNHWKEKGITKVYIREATNNTLITGVEAIFTSALVKEFARGNRIRLVSNEKEADAIVDPVVSSIATTFTPGTVAQLAADDPRARELSDFVIASEYTVTAVMGVSLVRTRDNQVLWTQSFARPKVYPANNRFGLRGTTSTLINGSQEAIALGEIAQFLATDAYDAMFEAF